MVVPAIYLILPLGPRGICQEVTPPPKDLTIPPASSLPAPTTTAPTWGLLGRPRPRGGVGSTTAPSPRWPPARVPDLERGCGA